MMKKWDKDDVQTVALIVLVTPVFLACGLSNIFIWGVGLCYVYDVVGNPYSGMIIGASILGQVLKMVLDKK